MEKRVVFRSKWLPYALLAPQIAVTVVFFFWPAAQAVYWSFLVQDPFGLSTTFVWFQNYAELFEDAHYLDSFRITAIFSTLVAVIGHRDLAAARGHGRPRAARRARLQDAA